MKTGTLFKLDAPTTASLEKLKQLVAAVDSDNQKSRDLIKAWGEGCGGTCRNACAAWCSTSCMSSCVHGTYDFPDKVFPPAPNPKPKPQPQPQLTHQIRTSQAQELERERMMLMPDFAANPSQQLHKLFFG